MAKSLTEIKSLARAHTERAIQALAGIMDVQASRRWANSNEAQAWQKMIKCGCLRVFSAVAIPRIHPARALA